MIIVRTLLWVLSLFFGIVILLSALEWAAEDTAWVDSADGSRPVQLEPCSDPCLMP